MVGGVTSCGKTCSNILAIRVFCHCRRRELTDSLVDVLLELIHRIGARAERKVDKAFLEAIRKYDLAKK